VHAGGGLYGKRYVIVTDGWSKLRGAPLTNVNICVDDGPAFFWRVEDASGRVKDTLYVVTLHQQWRAEIETVAPGAQFLGFGMDSTATNRAAMKQLQAADPQIIVLPCTAHALSNLLKHTAKYFNWVSDVYETYCTLSEKLINSSKLRSVLHELQEEAYKCKRGICAHVPTTCFPHVPTTRLTLWERKRLAAGIWCGVMCCVLSKHCAILLPLNSGR
jgi:hypothetical protein